jgi:homoserine dehydrogenase
VEPGTVVTADVNAVLDDEELDIVVEVIGGTGYPASDLVLKSAARGKSVVTANKALLAHALPSVRRAFNSRRRALGFEASVAGGIPIIRALQHSLLPDSITSVQGILNGTSNFILSSMAGGKPFAQALGEAQQAGFAEADPTADVEGHDAANKLVLLTQLAFGHYVPPPQVRTLGITGITPFDVHAALASGFAIKHLGVSTLFDAPRGAAVAAAVEGGGEGPAAPRLQRRLLDVFVSPALVPLGSPLATTGGAGNLVQVDSLALGRTSYGGAGAGREPTANSVLADLVAIAKRTVPSRPFPRPPPARVGLSVKPSPTLQREMFVRGPAPLANLLSAALWRQGRDFAPCSGGSGGGGSSGGAVVKAFRVDASAAELASLIARAARKVGGGAEAEAQLVKDTVFYPIIQ